MNKILMKIKDFYTGLTPKKQRLLIAGILFVGVVILLSAKGH